MIIMNEMENVVHFKINHPPRRQHVLAWLLVNYDQWPCSMTDDIGPEIFHGWRFIRCIDGEIVFADCIHKGITEEDFYRAFEYA